MNTTSPPTALVTGATSGFGAAIARRLAAAGWYVAITGRRADRLERLAAELRTTHGTVVTTLAFDVRNREETEAALAHLQDTGTSHLELLVNNAGLALGRSTLAQGDHTDWDAMLDTNVKGLLYVTRAALPLLRSAQRAHIVNIGSIAGTEVYPGGNVYCATKHAVDALSKALRQELLSDGIRVSQIRPGLAETDFSLVRYKGDAAKAADVYKGYEALTAADVADLLMYIVSAPPHVCINDVEITPTAQANALMLHKGAN
jgi:NADP-dependent 3-hydroxy acid dehydrogenase YdfG